MKKKIQILGMFLCLLCLSGCVKYNANMSIHKDKSMDYSILIAVNKEFAGEETTLTEEQKKSLEDEGYTVEDYDDGKMTGFKVTVNLKNIDVISSEEAVIYNVSDSDDPTTEKMFQVKKGFLKNTYIANFEFDSSSEDSTNTDDLFGGSDSSYDDSSDDLLEGSDSSFDDSYDTSGDDTLDGMDPSALAGMELTFSVNLPYSAKSNNATTVNNDNKDLTWNLMSGSDSNIQFEFELYNMSNIIIIFAVALGVIAIIIALILNGKNKKKKNAGNENVATNQTTEVNNQSMPQQPIGNTNVVGTNENVQASITSVENANPFGVSANVQTPQSTPVENTNSFGGSANVQTPQSTPVENANPFGVSANVQAPESTPVENANPFGVSANVQAPQSTPVENTNPFGVSANMQTPDPNSMGNNGNTNNGNI